MASIQGRELDNLREGIVSPLMDMMRTLSVEMRKNLAEEVSSIRSQLDEVDSKLYYVINRLEGNNVKTKGEQTHVPAYHAYIQHSSAESDTQRIERHNCMLHSSSESDEYAIVTGKPPTDTQRIERQLVNTSPRVKSKESGLPTVSLDKGIGQRDVTIDQKYEMRTDKVSQMTAETKPQYSAMNGHSAGQGEGSRAVTLKREEETNENASNIETKLDQTFASISETKGNRAQTFENVGEKVPAISSPKEFDDEKESVHVFNDTNGCFANEDSDTHHSPANTVSTHAERDVIRRQRLLNFGTAETHERSSSPPATSTRKTNVPYTSFKKRKTEFANDNRKTHLENVYTILQTDVEKQKSSEVNADKNLQPGSVRIDQGNDRMSVKTESIETVHVQDESRDKDQTIDKMSNNQQLASSGFKNEHGDEDNRFLAAAHEEISHASITRRSLSHSNLQLVKNGPRRPVETEKVVPRAKERTPVAGAVGGSHSDRSQSQEENGELVPDDVLYSLIEQQRLSVANCTDMKSQGIDTVICLDTSGSMAGKPIKKAVDTIHKLIDGFENNAIYSDLEENVGIVTFGKENKILCHLTNDYGRLRDSLESVVAGGPSPLWLGIALSLAEIKERGGACAMDPMTVLPRIILVTDGHASRKNLLEGDDSNHVDSQVVREILSLLNTCRSFTSYMECITFGPGEEDIMKTLTNGRMYTTNHVEQMTQFFKVQEEANNLVKRVMDGEISRDAIGEAIQNIKLGEKSKEDLQLIVTEALMSSHEGSKQSGKRVDKDTISESETIDANHSKAPEEEESTQQPERSEEGSIDKQKQPDMALRYKTSAKRTGLDSLSSADIYDLKAPLFGTAVVPNPDWVGFAARQNFTGTVIGARKKGLVKILWSDGTAEKCRYGVNGDYDFDVSADQTVDCSEIRIGSMVNRGKDWRWKDQDGGESSIGVVMKIDGFVIHVIWPHGGLGNYRYGYSKKYDVKLCETRHTEGTRPVWFIQEEEQWRCLPTEVSQSIEEMYKANHMGTFLVKVGEKSLRISIQNLQARDTSTQAICPIERRELSQEEWSAVTTEH